MCIFTIMFGNGDNIVKKDSYNFGFHSGNINIVHKFMFGLDQGNNNKRSNVNWEVSPTPPEDNLGMAQEPGVVQWGLV